MSRAAVVSALDRFDGARELSASEFLAARGSGELGKTGSPSWALLLDPKTLGGPNKAMLSRYIHLNPCNGAKPLVSDPESWPHSSFGGYARRGKRVDWVQYDQLHTYWKASAGGKDPDRAYRRYVKEGLDFADDPFKKELRDWVFGSADFLRRMVSLAEGDNEPRHQSTSRRLRAVSVAEIIDATARAHNVDPSDYAQFRSGAAGRDMAAWLCRQWTGATLEELGTAFGLRGTGSVSNLVRRAEGRRKESREWIDRQRKIEHTLALNTQHKA